MVSQIEKTLSYLLNYLSKKIITSWIIARGEQIPNAVNCQEHGGSEVKILKHQSQTDINACSYNAQIG